MCFSSIYIQGGGGGGYQPENYESYENTIIVVIRLLVYNEWYQYLYKSSIWFLSWMIQ